MYMQGVDAYRHSPLFTRYEQILLNSINNRKPLADAIAEQTQEGITIEEFDQMVQMHSQISY